MNQLDDIIDEWGDNSNLSEEALEEAKNKIRPKLNPVINDLIDSILDEGADNLGDKYEEYNPYIPSEEVADIIKDAFEEHWNPGEGSDEAIEEAVAEALEEIEDADKSGDYAGNDVYYEQTPGVVNENINNNTNIINVGGSEPAYTYDQVMGSSYVDTQAHYDAAQQDSIATDTTSGAALV
jgi:hypothetical protein